eukprot:3166730-Amphidinium_carterae.1
MFVETSGMEWERPLVTVLTKVELAILVRQPTNSRSSFKDCIQTAWTVGDPESWNVALRNPKPSCSPQSPKN